MAGTKKNNSNIIAIFAIFIKISLLKIDSLKITKSSDFIGDVKKLDTKMTKYKNKVKSVFFSRLYS